jgi:site-specific DNA-methyltransferase (adenine-specific)
VNRASVATSSISSPGNTEMAPRPTVERGGPLRLDGGPSARGRVTPYAQGKRWTLYAGDCLDVLAARLIPSDASIVADPPYGMGWDPDCRRFTGGQGLHERRADGTGGRNRPRIIGDDQPFDPAPWLGFPRVVLFGSNHFGARLPVGTTLVWLKRNPPAFGTFLSDGEIAWMKGGHGVYAHLDPNRGADREHPNQKPVGVMSWCCDRAKVPVDGLVVDPYCGSGSTGVAVLRRGGTFIGVERDPAHLPIAARRLADAEAGGVQVGLGLAGGAL